WLSTKAGSYATTGGLAPTGFLDSNTLVCEPDGRFEVAVSAEPQPGNWLPMTSASEMLIVRQTFLDRRRERPAELAIERVPPGAIPSPLDPARLDEQLARAARFVQGTARLFADWARDFAGQPNALPPQDQRRYQAAGGDPSIHYYHGYWMLDADQALEITVPH